MIRVLLQIIGQKIIPDACKRRPAFSITFSAAVTLWHRLPGFEKTVRGENYVTGLSRKTRGAHHKLAIHDDATTQAGSNRCGHRRELRIAPELHTMAVKRRGIPIVGVH